jgi:hypothetical protein
MNPKPSYFYDESLASRKAEAKSVGRSNLREILANEIAKVVNVRVKWVALPSAPMFRCRLIPTAKRFIQHIP